MNESDSWFWPYKPLASMVSAIVILLGLLLTVVILKKTINWPSENSETMVFIGVLVFSLLPVLLALFDVIVVRGGSIEYGSVKIDFSQASQIEMKAITVPVNMGVRGESVIDSGSEEIIDALKRAASCDAAIIDLEEGQAWWETRLLVLIAGAERLKKPGKIVFVGTVGGKKHCFQGWAHAYDLLPFILEGHPQYQHSYLAARAAARQWELVEPNSEAPNLPDLPPPISSQLPFPEAGLAGEYSWMAFDDSTGLPNTFLAEQLFAWELENKVESKESPKMITISRLEELFKPVLQDESIDQRLSDEEQISTFFKSDSTYMAITKDKKYLTLVSRLTVLNSILKTLVGHKKPAK